MDCEAICATHSRQWATVDSLCRLNLGDAFQAQLINRDFPHFEFLDLAGDGHWKRIHESDIAGYFEVRDPAPTEVLDILLREFCSLLQLHPGHHCFAILVVRDADYLHIADTRAGIEKLFDLARIDILSAADNHVFNATGDPAVAVLVHDSEVSAVQPAIQVEDAAGGVRVLVVALHHHVAARTQLSWHPYRNGTSSLCVCNLDLGVGQGLPHRAHSQLDGVFGGRLGNNGGTLSEAVSDRHLVAVHLFDDAPHHFDGTG